MESRYDPYLYLQNRSTVDDRFYSLPEDVQERVNARAERRNFQNAEELRRYVENLLRRA